MILVYFTNCTQFTGISVKSCWVWLWWCTAQLTSDETKWHCQRVMNILVLVEMMTSNPQISSLRLSPLQWYSPPEAVADTCPKDSTFWSESEIMRIKIQLFISDTQWLC